MSRMFRRAAFLLFFITIAINAEALTAATVYGVAFPDEVAGLKFQQTIDIESKQPGLGIAVYYRTGPSSADVYVYSARRNDLPRGYSESISREHYREAAGSIFEAQRRGLYRKADFAGDLKLSGYQCGRFAIIDNNGVPTDSVLCVTTRDGKFLKIRLSKSGGRLSDSVIGRFMAEWASDQ